MARFQCSTGPWYEQEVETFIRQRALEQAIALADDYRLLIVLDSDRLLGCMAHHQEMLLTSDGNRSGPILATRLHVCAIATNDQGSRLDDGTRLSDTLMATLIADALKTRRNAVLTGIVALENLRSMSLCERHGLRSQVQYDARHARLSGYFAPRIATTTRRH
jgi:hypothetical protein